ncbi:MAG: sigma-70 family RNA polymerase sigma factor [Gemmatimonadaceae bacterium]
MDRPPPPSTSSPSDAPGADVTGLLLAWGRGDQSAADRLVPAIYDELRRQAERAMRREGVEHTLQATALVHESYLRLVDQRRVEWRSRAHFFAIASTVMRRVLVDHARARLTAKRGGGVAPITLAGAERGGVQETDDVDLLALHEALERLAVLDPEQARLVELRYFGGLTIEETAVALTVSPATVKREWALARAWLRRELVDR